MLLTCLAKRNLRLYQFYHLTKRTKAEIGSSITSESFEKDQGPSCVRKRRLLATACVPRRNVHQRDEPDQVQTGSFHHRRPRAAGYFQVPHPLQLHHEDRNQSWHISTSLDAGLQLEDCSRSR